MRLLRFRHVPVPILARNLVLDGLTTALTSENRQDVVLQYPALFFSYGQDQCRQFSASHLRRMPRLGKVHATTLGGD